MGTKQSLYKAHKIKDDEFFTLYEDVANEVSLYKKQLKGKRIICPCDWDESYNEKIVFKEEGFIGPSNLLDKGGTIPPLFIKLSKSAKIKLWFITGLAEMPQRTKKTFLIGRERLLPQTVATPYLF